jgi:hypothetical protein
MNWKQRLDTERSLRRSIKKLKTHTLDAGDGGAIHLLRIARSAVKYGRTFNAQKLIEENRP